MHRRPRLILGFAAALIVALLAVFAWLIVDTHQTARTDLEMRFADRAERTAGSVQALFAAAFASGQQTSAERYAGEEISRERLEAAFAQTNNAYLAVLDGDGNVLALNDAAPASVVQHLESRSSTVDAVAAGAPFRAGDISEDAIPGTPLVTYVSSFETPQGRRLTAAGVPLEIMQIFISEFLARGPNREDARALTLDSHGRIVGGPDVARPGRFAHPELVEAYREGRVGEWGHDRVFVSAPVEGTTWRVVLDTTGDALYAPVDGARRIVPWIIWAAFSIASLVAWLFLRRAILAARAIDRARADLEVANVELSERAAALERSNQDLEQFASIASHDLREPLRKVQAFGEQLELRHGSDLDDEGRDYLRRMRDAAGRMETLIDDLLQFSRISTRAARFQRVSLDRVLAGVLFDLETVLEESDGRVEAGRLPELDADPVQMRQLLQNLVSNAIKFRRPGVAPEVQISGRRDGDRVVLEVADRGIGFDERYAERIFGVFKRLHTRAEFPGTGIGLALCRRIAERHGGTIEARGVEGQGATFTVILPATHQGSTPGPSPSDREAVPA